VEVETTPDLPASREGWLSLRVEGRAAPPAAPRRSARLVVLKGDADEAEINLNKTRTNIGRTLEVYRAGGPSRRNDLAFREGGEINRTVSREHAHILFTKKTGEYRLFNDRHYKPGSDPESACGLWIVREGMSRPVHHDARGVRLQPGDEIHFGRAVVRFVAR
jgi:pSer/pThr/pTyr-binding forkhead associated (FHA) protein